MGPQPVNSIFKIYGPILRDAKRCKFPSDRTLRPPLSIVCRLLAHACLSLARPYPPAAPEEAKKYAMKQAERTKKAMTNLQKIVPGMSDYEAWTETMQEYCITPYPPEIPKAEKESEMKKMTKEKKG